MTRAAVVALAAVVLVAWRPPSDHGWRTWAWIELSLGGALLTFMTSLASFSAPYIFGGGFRVMTTQIVSTRLNGDYAMAMVETVFLTMAALLGLWLLSGQSISK